MGIDPRQLLALQFLKFSSEWGTGQLPQAEVDIYQAQSGEINQGGVGSLVILLACK